MYKEIQGDLIHLALQGEFDVIVHGCNCFCTMASGIAKPMAETFNCNTFNLEKPIYKGDIDKLGRIDFQSGFLKNDKRLFVVNAYTQYHYGKNHSDGVENPLDYEALTLCLRKINKRFKGKHIGLPQIGCGLAGGDWNKVKQIIQQELRDCDVTIVIYKPN